jgi:cytochrome c biogenesis protein CcmG, thiol:disulfide interchange protein DsbE
VSRALLGIAAVCTLTLAAAASPGTARGAVAQIGEVAPAFLLKTLDGASMTGNFNGRPAYINVFTTWCSPCRGELPSILQQAKQYRDRVVFLFVDEQESRTLVQRFAQQFDVAPVALDPGQFAASFAVGGLPESIFIDRHGVVQYIYRGLIPADVLGSQLSQLVSS